MNHQRLYEIMSGDATDLAAAASRLGLSILAPGYGLAIAIRNKLFDWGIKKTVRLDRPVISVGNLTTGGTGKTPMVIELARRLIEQGHKPAVLLRGYMASEKEAASDEAQEIARELGDAVPVMPNPDRVAGAKCVLTEHPDVTVFLLDDGFQHRRVHRDLNLVLIDATRPFGFDHLLPRGLLREPRKNLCRADAVIITRCDQVDAEVLANLNLQIRTITGKSPIAQATSVWSGYRDANNNELPADYLQDKMVTAACAIGNPAAFQRMLEATAGEVLHTHSFDDHHTYTANDIQHILADAKQRNADAVVMTEKDWVKWADLLKDQNTDPQILRPILGTRFQAGAEAIVELLTLKAS